MKKKEILFLLSFSRAHSYHYPYRLFIEEICNNFSKVFFVNVDNLVENKKTKKYNKSLFFDLPRKIKFINPIDFDSLSIFLNNKNPLVINEFGREFKFYRLFYYLKKRDIPQIMITHEGRVGGGLGSYEGSYIFPFIKRVFIKKIQQKICVLLSTIGIFQKIDIRFLSNRVRYNSFNKNKKKFFRLPSIYKKCILVKSKQFDEKYSSYKKKITEEFILLLDIDIGYPELLYGLPQKLKDSTGKLKTKLVTEHYSLLNSLLCELSKAFKKKVIISIHPLYNLQKTIKRFNGKYTVIKYKTRELIRKSFIVLDFGSSSIIDAVVLKKKILSLRSELFREKIYLNDIYSKLLNLKVINIYKRNEINARSLKKDLDSRIKYYEKYLRKYASSNIKSSGNKQIVKIIKSRYF